MRGEFKWYKIWQLNVPNKTKMFLWRFAHNSLPMRRNVTRRRVDLARYQMPGTYKT